MSAEPDDKEENRSAADATSNADDLVDELDVVATGSAEKEATPLELPDAGAVADTATPSNPASSELDAVDTLGNAEDLVDESAGTAPQFESLPAKQFMPWHKPRKQFLREIQWCDAIAALIDELGLVAQGRPLAYLSLPGDELLDVRALHQHCNRKGAMLRFLGYNAIAEEPQRVAESRLSEAEVKSLPNVHVLSSGILHDPLEDLSLTSTMAHRQARASAPYDVINIDLCNGVANSKPQTRKSTLQALRALLEIQLDRSGSPWLLFLTTRIGRTLLDRDAQGLLHGRVSQNTKEQAFCDALVRELGITKEALSEEERGTAQLPDNLLHKALTLGVCKWLLGLIAGSNTGWRISLLQSYAYQIGPKHPQDMVSFGFRVERNLAPLVDPSALTFPVSETPEPHSEATQALALVAGVAGIIDVDKKLSEDADLLDRVTKSHGELLAQARYEKEKYLQWVADGCPR